MAALRHHHVQSSGEKAATRTGSNSAHDPSGRAGSRDGTIPTGEQLLARLQAEMAAVDGGRENRMTANIESLIAARRLSLPPADDPAAAAAKALAKLDGIDEHREWLEERLGDRIDLAVRLLQWLEADPQAALARMQGLDPLMLTISGARFGVETWAREADRATVLAFVTAGGVSPALASLWDGLGYQTGSAGDLALMKDLRARVPADSLQGFITNLASQWPEARAAELLPMALEGSNGSDARFLGAVLKRMPPEDAKAWLAANLASEGMDPKLRLAIRRDGVLGELQSSGRISMEEAFSYNEQMEIATGNGTEEAKSRAEQNRAYYEVHSLVNGGTMNDVLQAYRTGGTGADEVLSAIAASLPELAANSPALMKDRVFQALIQVDPAAALKLYEGLPEKELYRKVQEIGPAGLRRADPELMLKLFEALPHNPEHGPLQERFESWMGVTRNAYTTYGDDYAAWVMQMPEGVNRDMALSALAIQVEPDDPAQAKTLRAAKTLPASDRK